MVTGDRLLATKHETGLHRLLTDAGSDLEYEQYLTHLDENASRIEADAEQSLIEYSMHEVCGEFLRQVFGSPPPAELLERYIERYIAEWNRGVVDLPGLPAMLGRLVGRDHLVQTGVAVRDGDTGAVEESLDRLASLGVTDFNAVPFAVEGDADAVPRTQEFLAELARR